MGKWLVQGHRGIAAELDLVLTSVPLLALLPSALCLG